MSNLINTFQAFAAAKGKDERMTFAQNFVSGGIAGVASRTITSPLDVVKILAQVGTKDTQQGFLKTFSNVYQAEGLKAFWKGNFIACIRLFPYNAVQFASFNWLKIALADPNTGKLSVLNSLVAGALGGITATCITYPTDMVKTRLTVAHADPSKAKYHGIVDTFRVIWKEEGFFAFYKGMSTSIIGVVPFAGGTFMAYEVLENHLWGKSKDKLTPLENFINGCLAASFAQTFSFPFDTIRKKLQAQSKTVHDSMKPDVEFNGMMDAFVKTIKKHGPLGLWKGTTANLAKVAPYAGIMFAAFEACKRVFMYQNGFTVGPFNATPKPGVDQSLKPHELRKLLEEQKKR
jgi:solute carrier family 25 protein 43